MSSVNPIRVVQLIDSLAAGGAERMAVSYANELAKQIAFSGLVATREEGSLKAQIQKPETYLFLNRKKTIDFKALLAFRNYIKKNQVGVIHAHGSSYFFALLVKLLIPKIAIFWHDHNGNRIHLKRNNIFLYLASLFFKGVFTVNDELKEWALKNLWHKNIHFVPNFAVKNENEKAITTLSGSDSKRIVCLANLRNPKNHLQLLKAFSKSVAFPQNWSLHLIGADYNDAYSNELKHFITKNNLDHAVYFYGSCSDISAILHQAQIGVLASTYEGFPVTLLEYGLHGLAVATTNVGYCEQLVTHKKTGLLFHPKEEQELISCIDVLVENTEFRNEVALAYHKFVIENFSAAKIIELIIKQYTFEK